MANLYARRMVATMDPMAESKARGGCEMLLFDLDESRAAQARTLVRAASSPALQQFPRPTGLPQFPRPPNPFLSRVEGSCSSPAPATASETSGLTVSVPASSPATASTVQRPSTAPRARTQQAARAAPSPPSDLLARLLNGAGGVTPERPERPARPATAPRLTTQASRGIAPAYRAAPIQATANDGSQEGLLAYWQSNAAKTAAARLKYSHAAKRVAKRSEGSEPLRTLAPGWWTVPKPVIAAADAFDTRHLQRSTRAQRLRFALQHEPRSERKQLALRKEIGEVFKLRYVAPFIPVVEVERTNDNGRRKKRELAPPGEAPVRVAPAAPAFSLAASIWAPRAKWADSKALHDTPKVKQARFAIDWQCAIEQLGLSKVILRNDTDGHGSFDEDGDGLPEEVEEVGAVLWDCADIVYLFHTYYSTFGGDDFLGLSLNEWTTFIEDHNIASKMFPFCKRSDVDRIYLTVDTAASNYWKKIQRQVEEKSRQTGQNVPSSMAARHERADKQKQLSRVEFIGALVHIAIARYVASEEIADVSEAVHRLLRQDILPRASPTVVMDPETFRTEHCYTQAVTEVLAKHEASLRNIFTVVAGGGREMHPSKLLLGLDEWAKFMDAVGFLGHDLTYRDLRFAFVWSRMAVVDGRTERGHHRSTQLPFEGFLECICRISQMKSLPTDDEIEAYGHAHAGSYMNWMKNQDEEAYELMIRKRATPWGSEQTYQPVARCVDHVIAMLIYVFEAETAGSDNLALTEREALLWLKKHAHELVGADS